MLLASRFARPPGSAARRVHRRLRSRAISRKPRLGRWQRGQSRRSRRRPASARRRWRRAVCRSTRRPTSCGICQSQRRVPACRAGRLGTARPVAQVAAALAESAASVGERGFIARAERANVRRKSDCRSDGVLLVCKWASRNAAGSGPGNARHHVGDAPCGLLCGQSLRQRLPDRRIAAGCSAAPCGRREVRCVSPAEEYLRAQSKQRPAMLRAKGAGQALSGGALHLGSVIPCRRPIASLPVARSPFGSLGQDAHGVDAQLMVVATVATVAAMHTLIRQQAKSFRKPKVPRGIRRNGATRLP